MATVGLIAWISLIFTTWEGMAVELDHLTLNTTDSSKNASRLSPTDNPTLFLHDYTLFADRMRPKVLCYLLFGWPCYQTPSD